MIPDFHMVGDHDQVDDHFDVLVACQIIMSICKFYMLLFVPNKV